MTTAEVEALFARTLAGDYEAEDAWDAVRALRLNGSREIFEHAAAWCLAEDQRKRGRAADVLCQLQASGDRKFCDESYTLLAKMLEKEQDPNVLDAILVGLGHLDNPTAVPLILRYLDHPDRLVRFAVAVALGHFSNDAQSAGGLLKLTSDPEDEVRDWAVFGLGVMGDADSPEIREALLRCLNDEDDDVREEAAVGLGMRRDPRLIPVLLTMLEAPNIKVRVAEAAAALLGMDKDPPEWTAADYRAAVAKIEE